MAASRYAIVAAVLFASLSPAGASSAGPEIAFEVIALKHLTAGEVAPLLAPRFQFVGRTVAPPSALGRGDLASFVPEGVKLITAGHQSSHTLLVAGTAGGAAELRGLLATIDAKPQAVHLSFTVYPAPLSVAGVASRPAKETEPSVAWLTLEPGRTLAALGLPAQVQPTAIEVDTASGASEFVPLPAYRGWPQVLLEVTARMNADETVTLGVGAGVLDDLRDPLAAVEQARSSPVTIGHVNVRQGEKPVVVLSRGGAGITVVIEVARGKTR